MIPVPRCSLLAKGAAVIRAVLALTLVCYVGYLPVHLLIGEHCDTPDRGHDHTAAGHHHHGPDEDPEHGQHHLTTDHDSEFRWPRQPVFFAPDLFCWSAFQLPQPLPVPSGRFQNPPDRPPLLVAVAPVGPRGPPAA